MNKRILMIVMVAGLVSTTGGCTPFRDFFFGRGAKCGLCTKIRAPFQPVAPAVVQPVPPCNAPVYGCQPDPCAVGGVYAPAPNAGTCNSCYGSDPYVGNGVYGAPAVQGDWQQRYNSNYAGYPGYKIDRDGNRIIFEEPLPPGASVVN